MAPTDLRRAELLIIGYAYREYKQAQIGFFVQLDRFRRQGFSTRDLAAACGMKPRDMKFLLLQGERDAATDSDTVRRPIAE